MASNPCFNKCGLTKSSKKNSLNNRDPLTEWEQFTSYFVASNPTYFLCMYVCMFEGKLKNKNQYIFMK